MNNEIKNVVTDIEHCMDKYFRTTTFKYTPEFVEDFLAEIKVILTQSDAYMDKK